MPAKRTDYGAIARFFHWAIAALIVLQFLLAELAEWAEDDGERLRQLALLANHKSVGMTILGLAILRVGWRALRSPPTLPSTMPQWQIRASSISHWSLYILLFSLPITGWLMSSATAYSVSWFGLFTFPDLVAPSTSTRDALKLAHETLGKALLVVAVVHILAALKHYLVDKDGVLGRMTSATSLALFAIVIVLGLVRLVRAPTHSAQIDPSPTVAQTVTPAVQPVPVPAPVPITPPTMQTATEPEQRVADESMTATADADTSLATARPATPAQSRTPAAADDTSLETQALAATNNARPADQPTRLLPPSGTERPVPESAATDAPVTIEAAKTPATESQAAPTPARWVIDYAESYIEFEAEQAGAAFTGRWQQWDADMLFSPIALEDSKFIVTINVAGVSTNDQDRDSTLLDDEWFAASKHPTTTFETLSFAQDGNDYVATSTLTIKGQPSPVKLRFSVATNNNERQLRGTATLDRLALGVGTGEWSDTEWIGQFVRVTVNVKATVE
ncbi:MAG: cytochrome b/b6 domain-containing protein [Pseudomonadota bacterium]